MSDQHDELLVALVARVIKLEAAVNALATLSLQHMAKPTNDQSFEVLAGALAKFRAQMIHNQVDSLVVQFPELARILRDHVLVSESDLRDFLRPFDRET